MNIPLRRTFAAIIACGVIAVAGCGTNTEKAATVPAAAAGTNTVKAATAPSAAGIPAYDHVVLTIFENHKQSQIVGASNAPYLTSLASQGANFTRSYAIEHPSQPNYLDLFSGSNQGVTDDSCPHKFAADNIGHQLISAGKSFSAYSEGLPSVGSTVCTSGNYARKHNPWVNFTNLATATNQPLTAFPSDFSRLPTYSWIVPNLCNDMHDCSVSTGDTWAKNNLDAFAQWAKTHNSLLIVTFDEDDSSGTNRIATIFEGAKVTPGNYNEHIDHYTVLRTIEDMYGLSPIGNAANRAAITDVFNSGSPR